MTASGGSFALQLQLLPSRREKVLAAAHLLSARNDSGRFQTSEVAPFFQALDVPPPSNVSGAIVDLLGRGELIRHGVGRPVTYALTPVGARATAELFASLDAAEIETLAAGLPRAEFAHVDHTIIPSWAAPPRWQAGIARFLERHPFDSNVFCMTRFPSEGDVSDPVAQAIVAARETLAGHGLTLHLATDKIVDDDLFGNVGAYMWGCRYGLGIVEDRVGRGLNHNAMIEVSGMIFTGRRCAVLKDHTSPSLPTDLVSHIYRSVDLDDLSTVRDAVAKWAGEDLGHQGAAVR